MPDYSIGRFRGGFAVVWYDQHGKRRRHTLDAKDARGAEHEAAGVYAAWTRPRGKTVAELWDAYLRDKAGRAVTEPMRHYWKAMRVRFGPLAGDEITVEDCRAHVKERRDHGIADRDRWQDEREKTEGRGGGPRKVDPLAVLALALSKLAGGRYRRHDRDRAGGPVPPRCDREDGPSRRPGRPDRRSSASPAEFACRHA